MGQKVYPHGLRVGVTKDWGAKWYASRKSFAGNLMGDNRVRGFVKEELFSAGISKIKVERVVKRTKLNAYTAKPGTIIGKGRTRVEVLEARLARVTDNRNLLVNIAEVKNAEANAQLIVENIAI